MTSVIRTIALSFVLAAALATAAEAQEGRRRAQARERAPQGEAPPAAAPAPPPARQDGGERARGTDSYGRVRAPREGADNGGRSGAGSYRAEPRQRAIERAEPAPVVRSEPEGAAAPAVRNEPVRQPPPTRAAPPSRAPVISSPPALASSASAEEEAEQDRERRRAQPRGSRPRGDNPAVGRAVPRDGRDGRSYPGGTYRGGTYRGRSGVYTSRGRVYNNYYYYYPRRWYPYGYGAFGGLGYFYYDPYTWYSYDPYWSRPHAHYYSGSYYGSRYYDYDDDYVTGEIRLQVHPRHAEVYVDGYFAGHVDDFDGMFQGLRLEEGPYKIEIVAPGYETLVFDVRIIPGRKISYRGELRPRP